jgi:Tfp pilus assembly protein FimT
MMKSASPNRFYSATTAGITLAELMVVIFLIGLFSAVSVPYLLPAILFTEHEGAARHLSNFGRAAMAHAEMFREDLTIHFDLDEQEYWAVRKIIVNAGKETGADEIDQMELLSKLRSNPEFSTENFQDMLEKSRATEKHGGINLPEGFDDEAANRQMDRNFELFARARLEAQARNVRHDLGFLEEAGSLFDAEDQFNLNLAEVEEEELKDINLSRTRLPENVRIDAIILDGITETHGEVEVPLSVIGLARKAGFYLANGAEEYFTVIWDPILGTTRVYQEKVDIEAH